MKQDVERISPAKAKQYLAMRGPNRALSPSKVLEMALAMEAGDWSLNGETIKFNVDGKLIDGQHRLEACVLAEKPFDTAIVRGIADENAMSTIDVGKARSHSDVWSIAGHQNAHSLSSIALMVYMVEKGRVGWNGFTSRRIPRSSPLAQKLKSVPMATGQVRKEELLAFAEPLMADLAAAGHFAVSVKARKLFGAQAVGAVHYYGSKKDKAAVELFLKDAGEGIGLQAGDPAYAVREHIIARTAKGSARVERTYILGMLIKAFNARRDGRSVKVLRVGEDEPFPKVK